MRASLEQNMMFSRPHHRGCTLGQADTTPALHSEGKVK